MSTATSTYPAYPSTADVAALLTTAGLSSSGLDLTTALGGAIASLERECGRNFLAGAAAVYREDPPTIQDGYEAVLYLSWDAAAVSGIVYTPTGGTSTTFVEGTDYDLLPYNAAALGIPIDRIAFYNRRWTDPLSRYSRRSLYITAQRGYGTAIPLDVWQAMVMDAAVAVVPALAVSAVGALQSWKDADVSETYGAKPYGNLYEDGSPWAVRRQQVISHYKRISIG